MFEQDRPFFIKTLRKAYMGYANAPKLTDDQLEFWFNMLKNYDLRVLNNAIERCAMECRYPFSIAEVNERARQSIGESNADLELKAEQVLKEFLSKYSRIYDYIADDWRAAFAIAYAGDIKDWDDVKNEFKQNQLRRNFIHRYANADIMCPPEKRFFYVKGSQVAPVRSVIYIGDYDRCHELAVKCFGGMRFHEVTPNPKAPKLEYQRPHNPTGEEKMLQEIDEALASLEGCSSLRGLTEMIHDLMQKSKTVSLYG